MWKARFRCIKVFIISFLLLTIVNRALAQLSPYLATFEEVIRSCDYEEGISSVDAEVGTEDLTLSYTVSGGSLETIVTIPFASLRRIGFANGIVFICRNPGCIHFVNRSRAVLFERTLQNRRLSRYTFFPCVREDLVQAYRLLQAYCEERDLDRHCQER
jgi:hypothetical protein